MNLRHLEAFALFVVPSALAPVHARAQLNHLGVSPSQTATNLRNLKGKRITVVCPAIPAQQAAGVRIWGTGVYTDDSGICVAAIHSGALSYDSPGAVTILVGGQVNSFAGTTSNGITSQSYGAYGYSYEIDRSGAVGQVEWSTSAQGLPDNFTRATMVECPAGGTAAANVWGTDVYTNDSSICVAAIHFGLIASAAAGGRVAVFALPGQTTYPASLRNGIQSGAWSAYTSSFRVARDSATVGGAISSFTVVANPRWGAHLSWDSSPGVTWYGIERSEAGGPFVRDPRGSVGGHAGGRLEKFDFDLKPGTHYEYKVSALDGGSGGPALYSSSPRGFDSHPTYPVLTNMTATVSETVESLPVPIDADGKMATRPARRVSWSWDLVPNYPQYMATFDRNIAGSSFRWPPEPMGFRPPNEIVIEAGHVVRFCATIVDDVKVTTPTCVGTVVPAAPEVVGVVATPETPTGVATGVPVADATPPDVKLAQQPTGFLLTWPATWNAVRFTVCRESPAGSPCNATEKQPSGSFGAWSLSDVGLPPGSSHRYRVRAWRSDGHFGETAVNGTAGDIPPPFELSIGQRDARTGFLRWRPALIPTNAGSSTSVRYHQVTGPDLPARILDGSELAVPIPSGRSQYVWSVCSLVQNPAGGWYASGTAATLTYDGAVFTGRMTKGNAPCIPSREVLGQGTVIREGRPTR